MVVFIPFEDVRYACKPTAYVVLAIGQPDDVLPGPGGRVQGLGGCGPLQVFELHKLVRRTAGAGAAGDIPQREDRPTCQCPGKCAHRQPHGQLSCHLHHVCVAIDTLIIQFNENDYS